jgi:hypothetical protein
MHWDGYRWTRVPSPNGPRDRSYLAAIGALSSTNVWLVGSTADYGGQFYSDTLVEHQLCSIATPTGTPPTATTTRTRTSTATPTATRQTNTPAATFTGTPRTATPTPTHATTGTPCAISFSDVQPADYFYTAVQYPYCYGVISGYQDDTFRPFNNTTRGQLTKIVVLAQGWPLQCPGNGHFSDVAPDNPFYCHVETAYIHGIISGYADGTFRPGNNVTRGQLSKIVVTAMGWQLNCPSSGHFSDVPPNDPFYCHIETAFNHGIISGYADGTFRPGNAATRGQISKIVYQAITGP